MLGPARQGQVWRGTLGLVWSGKVRLGRVWLGAARRGIRGVVRSGLAV